MIGGSWAGTFAGEIGTVSMYSFALTSAQIKQNFTAVRGIYEV